VPNGTASLVDTSGGKAVAALYSTRLDIAPRNWESGFPGVPGGRNEWFQVVYDGEFVTARKGGHQFELLSDDGSKLIIDGTTVTNNDGRHEPKSEEVIVVMKPGHHKIRVEYFQGPRVEIALQLFVTPPGGPKQILDVSRVL